MTPDMLQQMISGEDPGIDKDDTRGTIDAQEMELHRRFSRYIDNKMARFRPGDLVVQDEGMSFYNPQAGCPLFVFIKWLDWNDRWDTEVIMLMAKTAMMPSVNCMVGVISGSGMKFVPCDSGMLRLYNRTTDAARMDALELARKV